MAMVLRQIFSSIRHPQAQVTYILSPSFPDMFPDDVVLPASTTNLGLKIGNCPGSDRGATPCNCALIFPR